MRTVSILAVLCAVSPFQIRNHNYQMNHDYSWECCQQQGGVAECGLVFKDCCKVQCVTVLGLKECPDDQRMKTQCQNTCENVCESQGGKVCNNGLVGGSYQCCTQQNCEGGLTPNCKPNSLINVSPCIQQDVVSKVRQTLGSIISGQ